VELVLVILQRRVAALSPAALERFVLRARRAVGLRGTADVLVTGNNSMRSLNRQFRGKNKATDVLSFPAADSLPTNGRKLIHAGEVAISAEIAAENASRFGHSTAEEVKILALHGILHLAGFDHERDNGEMARKEMKLRRALRLPEGLLQRSEPENKTSIRIGRRRGSMRRA
jgi:probable rRNA maturation factor